ncbi:hypothetical protein PV327_004006 [Microctonus hyperodae]|uniref:Circadian locomoter output cycles protein kaput n=1 Tax=Microctonus hyperodae TaxID=165561 RepID=A0AA39L1S0_MICHY|nr:hypothetical protein PV327_004006 [Microctonus hyperodae]
MTSYVTMGSRRNSNDVIDDDNDDKDDTKRKSRNLSEKKRRDQFNMLVNELGSMVSTNTRKMDKSTVLKSTILFLKNHNEIAVRSRAHEIQETWKPSFLSNEEFTHLILEALDGFIIVFSSNGRIYYASESVSSLLGYLPSELANSTIYEITYQEDQSLLYNVLLNPCTNRNRQNIKSENQVSFTCHIKRGSLDFQQETTYERVNFVGYFRSDTDIESLLPNNHGANDSSNDIKEIFVGTGRLHTPQLIQDMLLVDETKAEFTSRHSLEWKFLFLDHRAPPIIGYLPFEVLGTSGYDYYHVDDLEKVVTCHESLMQKGEGTSCYYRFLTKGQQWIWLQTRFYIDYNQWNSKPEFIVCTHKVASYTEVIKKMKQIKEDLPTNENQVTTDITTAQVETLSPIPPQACTSVWSPKSWKTSKSVVTSSRSIYHGAGSDTTSISVDSQNSRQSTLTTNSSKPKLTSANSSKPMAQSNSGPPHTQKSSDVDSLNSNYIETHLFNAESNLFGVSTCAFLAPPPPNNVISLSNSMRVNQQSTVTQINIQDELQRKHEELQQLIVLQQEELRRVSEQLLIARYGILSPIINVNLPYNDSICQPSVRCDDNQTNDNIQLQVNSDTGTTISTLESPVSLPLPIVPMETFSHPTAAVIPIAPSLVLPTTETGLIQGNSRIQYVSQSQHSHQLQRHGLQQIQHIQSQTAQIIHQNEQIIPYQICQQPDIMYSIVEPSVDGQHNDVTSCNQN